MPFINRIINHEQEPSLPLQHVKLEQPLSDLSESEPNEQSKELSQGKWSEQENLKFVIFVNYYQEIFSSRHKRKVCKIFKAFEQYLHDRTAAQCRSHYQKVIQKFKTVAKVKRYYERHFGKDYYSQQFQIFKASWEKTHPPISSKDIHIKEHREFGVQTDQPEAAPAQPVPCPNCNKSINSTQTLQPAPQLYNPFLFWNQFLPSNGVNYVYYVPQEEEPSIQANAP